MPKHVRHLLAAASLLGLACSSEAPRIELLAGTAVATATNGVVNLTATAPLGGVGPYRFQWHRGTRSGFSPQRENALPEKTSLVAVDENVVDGTPYYYRLVATDQNARMVTYDEVSATPLHSTLAPGSATATAANGQVILSGTSPSGGVEPYTYQWHRSTSAGFSVGPANAVAGRTSLSDIDASVTNGVTYFYKLVAADNLGSSVTYTTVSATPLAPLAAGTSSVVAGDARITLTATAASGGVAPYAYQWYRSTTSGFTPDGSSAVPGKTGLSDVDAGLVNGTTYYYRLRGTDNAATSVTYAEVSATPRQSLTAGIPSATPGNGEVALSATPPTGGFAPYAYQWHRATTSGFVPGTATIVAGLTSRNGTDVGLTNGTTYFYRMVASDSVGTVVTYPEVSATPIAAFAPGAASAAPGDGLITLSATAPSGGVSPYTYQWHRGTTTGFVPAAGTALAGKTTLAETDATVTNGTAYFYRLIATDNAGASVSYAELSATPAASTEPTPSGSDVVLYDDDFSGFATLTERHARFIELNNGTAPFYFFDIAPGRSESIIAGGFNGSPYAYRINVAGNTTQYTSDGSVRYKNVGNPPYGPAGSTLIVDLWVRFNLSTLQWFKGVELFHPSGQDRTQFGPFLSSSAAGPWNLLPQSNQKPIWMHLENGAPDAPKTYRRWSDMATGQWLKLTVMYKASSGTGTATDGVNRMWINGEKIIDASLSGLNTGWMQDRPACCEPPFVGNVSFKGVALTGLNALQSLADDPVQSIIFPGVIAPNNVAGTIDVGRVRVWYRP